MLTGEISLPFQSALWENTFRNDAIGLSWEQIEQYLTTKTASGISVNADSAARAIPVQACITLIAGGIISMPLRVLRREFKDGTVTQTPADEHDYWWLFNEQPNSESTSAEFWERIVKDKLLRGRAYARIIRESKKGGIENGTKVKELMFLEKSKVTPAVKWDSTLRRNVITAYAIQDGDKRYSVTASDMLDFRGNVGSQDGVSSIVESARNAIGITLTIEEYCGKFFANGGTPRTVLEYPQGTKLDPTQMDALREAYVKRYGGTENTSTPLVLQNGGKVSKLSFTSEEMQMLEARKFQVIEIARAFGVPPFMIGETEKTSAWGTGIEQMSQGFIRYTLGPHITAIEQEVNRKLFSTSTTFVDFDEESLSRGDMKAMGEWFRQMVGGSQGPGIMTIDEVRRRLKLPTVTGGDNLYNPIGANDAQSTQSADGAAGEQSSQTAPV